MALSKKCALISGASTCLLLFIGAGAAAAQTAGAAPASADGPTVDTVIVAGTRTTGLRAVDSPAPIQVLGSAALQRVG